MKYSLTLILTFVMLSCFPSGIAGITVQDDEKKYPDYYFKCTQNDSEFILNTKISYWNGEQDIPLKGYVINFRNIAGEKSIQLDAIETDINGVAEFRIEKTSDRLINLEGKFTFMAIFEGNQDYEGAEELVELKSLSMQLDFREIDSVKYIVAEAVEIAEDGTAIPLDAADVYFFVPRSFSLLPFGEGWFEEGSAELEFPVTIPGDSIGNLTIIARIEDHELYGNVEVTAMKNWGVARPHLTAEKRRGLGDTDAPLWMVYTLIVLLSVVWFHYLYVFFLMFKIKKLQSN